MNEEQPKTEYIVFSCTRCHQYTYAKTKQKGKKCPRCGRMHVMKELKGEIVQGPTAAMQLVRQYQNQNHTLAKLKSSKRDIAFKSNKPSNSFVPAFSDDYQLNKLLRLVIKWQHNENISLSQGFPEYVLEYIAKEIEPNSNRRSLLIKKLHRLEQFTRISNGNVYVEDE